MTNANASIDTLRRYLQTVIGFGNDNEGLAKANAIIAEGLTEISDLVDLAEGKDGIKTLCTNVRKPSGLMPQPGWNVPDPNPFNLEAPMIAQSGTAIPTLCEQRLAAAAYACKIYESIGRSIEIPILNRLRLKEFQRHKEATDNYSETGSLPALSKSFTIQKFLDQFPTFLREILGVSKVSLAYVIRESAVVPVTLPELKPNKPWSIEHNSMMEELIAHTPHSGPAYEADNARVYNLLVSHLAGTTALGSTSRWQKSRNGRGAYLDLMMHNMSSAKWEKTISIAEKVLNERKWNGKNARYPLRIHMARHREAYNDLVKASQKIQYSPPNETSRVRYLLSSIETADPTICSAKTAIQADNVKKNDFESAADFLLVTAPNAKTHHNDHNISGVRNQKNNNRRSKFVRRNNNSNGKGKIKTGPKTGVEIRYYTKGEWYKLSTDEQNECREIRQASLQQKRKNDDDDTPSAKIAALETKISEMKEQIVSALSSRNSNPTPSNASNAPLPPSCLRPPVFSQRE